MTSRFSDTWFDLFARPVGQMVVPARTWSWFHLCATDPTPHLVRPSVSCLSYGTGVTGHTSVTDHHPRPGTPDAQRHLDRDDPRAHHDHLFAWFKRAVLHEVETGKW